MAALCIIIMHYDSEMSLSSSSSSPSCTAIQFRFGTAVQRYRYDGIGIGIGIGAGGSISLSICLRLTGHLTYPTNPIGSDWIGQTDTAVELECQPIRVGSNTHTHTGTNRTLYDNLGTSVTQDYFTGLELELELDCDCRAHQSDFITGLFIFAMSSSRLVEPITSNQIKLLRTNQTNQTKDCTNTDTDTDRYSTYGGHGHIGYQCISHQCINSPTIDYISRVCGAAYFDSPS